MILSTVVRTPAPGIVRGKFIGKNLAYTFIIFPLVIPVGLVLKV
jgi:ABC-type spermidine/putrescine transport system permease subunit II